MPTEFPKPRTDREALDHMAARHGLPWYSPLDWQRMFGAKHSPLSAHARDHEKSTKIRRDHRHSRPGE